MCHNKNNSCLPHQSWFSTHVWPSNKKTCTIRAFILFNTLEKLQTRCKWCLIKFHTPVSYKTIGAGLTLWGYLEWTFLKGILETDQTHEIKNSFHRRHNEWLINDNPRCYIAIQCGKYMELICHTSCNLPSLISLGMKSSPVKVLLMQGCRELRISINGCWKNIKNHKIINKIE